jgi:hypothetical protein
MGVAPAGILAAVLALRRAPRPWRTWAWICLLGHLAALLHVSWIKAS